MAIYECKFCGQKVEKANFREFKILMEKDTKRQIYVCKQCSITKIKQPEVYRPEDYSTPEVSM